jgi:fructose-1,6-bisphosphatase/inositol monophosphatase family enzyme
MNDKILNELEDGLVGIGDQIKSWRRDERFRSVLDPVEFKTQADIKANILIKNLLEKLDPKCKVISEEDGIFKKNRPKKYWLIDPIDGTASWFDGFDGFVTQIAYIENGVPYYGAVYAPCLKKLWTASINKGAHLNGKKMDRLKYVDRFNLIDNYPEPRRVAKKIYNAINITKYIECGSLGLKSCMVADGTADIFVKDVIVRDWDIAPAAVILKEVGGVIKNFNGKDMKYMGKFEKTDGLIVTRDSNLFEMVLRVVNDNG